MKPLVDEIAEALAKTGAWSKYDGYELVSCYDFYEHDVETQDEIRKNAQAAIDVVERRLLSAAERWRAAAPENDEVQQCQELCVLAITETWKVVKGGDV